MGGDGAPDVAGVALAQGILDVLPDRVELYGQILDVGVSQVGEGRNIRNRHGFLPADIYARISACLRHRRCVIDGRAPLLDRLTPLTVPRFLT